MNGLPVVGSMMLACVYLAVGSYAAVHRPRQHFDPASAEMPLYVRDLTKTIDGRSVVTDVSFAARRGAVLGLLGPNGAGKTTLLRILTGLAEPDSGVACIFGWHVRPGAPVLSRVGACIESPGLLPHLTGRANLRTYWSVTGRPTADASFDEVERLSGLGEDLDRKVGEYSLGMRHRLALAQAMLGLPDLLLLDEPAHGLDPGQIRFLRRILGEYAASGRTVVVSSHHLDEVEATCTDVVVLHRSRVALAGPVSERSGGAVVPPPSPLAEAYFRVVDDA